MTSFSLSLRKIAGEMRREVARIKLFIQCSCVKAYHVQLNCHPKRLQRVKVAGHELSSRSRNSAWLHEEPGMLQVTANLCSYQRRMNARPCSLCASSCAILSKEMIQFAEIVECTISRISKHPPRQNKKVSWTWSCEWLKLLQWRPNRCMSSLFVKPSRIGCKTTLSLGTPSQSLQLPGFTPSLLLCTCT